VIGPGAGVWGPNPKHSNLFFRVCEDGVKPIKPEARYDWARGGCLGAKSYLEFLIGFRVCEDGVNLSSWRGN